MKLLFFASLVSLASCSGYLKIRLKSDYLQDVTVLMDDGTGLPFARIPLRLLEKEEQEFGRLRVDFEKSYTLSILGGKIEQLGINSSTYQGEFKPLRGRISPKELHLPMSGLELEVECDDKWSGDKCDILCEKTDKTKKCAIELVEQDLILNTNYTLDMEKLPTIIQRLKETMKIDNKLRTKAPIEEKKNTNGRQDDESREEVVIELNKEKIVQKTSKWMGWSGRSTKTLESSEDGPSSRISSIVSDMMKKIASPERQEKKKGFPFQVKMEMHENQDSEPTTVTKKSESKRSDEERKSLDKLKTGINEFKNSLMEIFGSMGRRKEEKKEDSEQERFGDMGGLGALSGMMSPMSFLSMLPRMPRHATAVEGSGHVPDDFEIDQIIKN